MDGVDQDKPETDFFLDQAQPTIPPSLQTVLKGLLIGMKAPSWNLVRRVLSCNRKLDQPACCVSFKVLAAETEIGICFFSFPLLSIDTRAHIYWFLYFTKYNQLHIAETS
jgi:hypothetical protein